MKKLRGVHQHARHTAADYYRKTPQLDRGREVPIGDDHPARDADPTLALDVREALDRLPATQRQLCELLMRGYSKQDAGAELGLTGMQVSRLLPSIAAVLEGVR